MSVKDNLEIILITYNRKEYLKKTFEQILADNSPVKDFEITVLDNKSTDGSFELISEFAEKFPNIKPVVHNRNIGGNANILRAFELAKKKYVWVLCDDDKYDWTNWSEVEDAIEQGQDLICLADYLIDDKSNMAQIIMQLTFLPAGIYKTENITPEVMLNAAYNMWNLFPHLQVSLGIINNKKNVYVCKFPIIFNGMDADLTDVSYVRGYDETKLHPRARKMLWTVGYLNSIEIIEDKDLRKACVKLSNAENLKLCKYFKQFFKYTGDYRKNVFDVFFSLDFQNRILFILIGLKFYISRIFFTYPYKKILSFFRESKGDRDEN